MRDGARVVTSHGDRNLGRGRCVTSGFPWPARDERLGAPGNATGRTGYVVNVVTDVDHRRRGLSRLCTEALVEWFCTCDVSRVQLRASAEAEPLYRSLGFARTPHPGMQLSL